MKLKLIMGVMVLFGVSHQVYAANQTNGSVCTYPTNNDAKRIFNFGTIALTDSMANGSVIATSTSSTASGSFTARCYRYRAPGSGYQDNLYFSMAVMPQSKTSIYTGVYPTSIPGVGARVNVTGVSSGVLAPSFFNSITGRTQASTYEEYTISPFSTTNQYYQVSSIELVKTGRFSGSSSGLVQEEVAGYLFGNPADVYLKILVNANFTRRRACELSNTNMMFRLPEIGKSEFKQVGSVYGTQSMDVDLKCVNAESTLAYDVGLTFNYTTESGNTSVISNQAGTGKAEGVGTQLLLNGEVVEESKRYSIATLNRSSSLSEALNLKAQYVQTDNTVTSGEVQGMATMTIDFL